MQTNNPRGIHFPETKIAKFLLVLFTFALALIITAFITGNFDLIAIVFFPSGLLALLPDRLADGIFGRGSTGTGFGGEVTGISFVALLYLGLSSTFVFAKNQRAIRVAYFTFVILLIANIAGCSFIK